MENVMIRLGNMSFAAGCTVLLILVLRILIKRLPKAYSYGLWMAALFRFLCPVANAMLDITALVQKHRDSLQTQFLNDLGIPVRECILYVQQHTNQNLSVQSVADALGYQRTYLSAYFSKTMGFHLSDYIYRCKLEEAKTLLTYTDKDISEISSYLCFSSQSHFQLRFKKAFHMTPAQYRRMNSQKQ